MVGRQRRNAWWVGLVVAGVVPVAGCSGQADRIPVYEVQGKVTYQGKPAAGGFVVFHKVGQDAEAIRPTAPIQSDGSFALTTYENRDGAPAGDYAVTVSWNQPVQVNREWQSGPNVIPGRYSDPTKTPLKITVNQSANSLAPFEIKR